MAGLNEIAAFCPHFCKYIGTINTKIDPKSRKVGNPFNIETKYPIEKEVLLCDYIDKSYKLYNYIKASNEKINENILYSTIKQVLLATSILLVLVSINQIYSQEFKCDCYKDLVFLYTEIKSTPHLKLLN